MDQPINTQKTFFSSSFAFANLFIATTPLTLFQQVVLEPQLVLEDL